jgi:hypothetical protein
MAATRHHKAVTLLAEKGADMNLPGENGRFPLYLASAITGNVKVVKLYC